MTAADGLVSGDECKVVVTADPSESIDAGSYKATAALDEGVTNYVLDESAPIP